MTTTLATRVGAKESTMLTITEHARAAEYATALFGPASRLAAAHRAAVQAQVTLERRAYTALADWRLASLFADSEVGAFRVRAESACYAAGVPMPKE